MGRRRWRGLMLASMLILLAVPVHADGDGIGMNASLLPSFVDVDDGSALDVYLQGFGANGTATLEASISNAEGSVVWSVTDTISLGDGDTTVLVLNLSTVPPVQQLELVLSATCWRPTPRTSRQPRSRFSGSAPVCRGGHGQFRSSGEPQRSRRPNWRLSS